MPADYLPYLAEISPDFPVLTLSRWEAWASRIHRRGFSQGDALMIRHLTTLILTGVVGSMLLVGSAEACHRPRCGGCAAPPVCPSPPPPPFLTPSKPTPSPTP